MDVRGDEPAWTSHARRITPGQTIRINRDDDMDEAGDIGLRVKPSPPEDDSTGSSSSRSRGNEDMEMQERRRGSVTAVVPDSSEDNRNEAVDGSRTPPLAEYREGNHLVVERKRSQGSEVDVEVIRNHFAPDKKTQRTSFTHPRPLNHAEVDALTANLPKSIEHAASAVREGGRDALDKMGLGMMHSHTSDGGSIRTSVESRRSAPNEATSATVPEDAIAEDDEPESSSRDGANLQAPVIHVNSRSSGRLSSIRSKIFRKTQSRESDDTTPRDLEEGGGENDESMLSPYMPFPITRQRTSETEATPIFNPERPPSPPRAGGIRFAEDSSPSSNTAPGPPLGVAIGHKKSGSFNIPRTASIQSSRSGRGGILEPK